MAEPGAEASRLTEQAAELGVALEPHQADTLLAFRDLLLRWNRAFNLISRRDTARLVPRHLLDSLTVLPWLAGESVLDLGTGAGLPGVPLAIAREDTQFTLIDLSERKIRFVGQARRSLGLTNVTARCADVGELPAGMIFDTVVSRAVADPATAWKLAQPRLRSGGRLVLMTSTSAGGEDPRRDEEPLPAGAHLEARPQVQVPGLPRPHEMMILRHMPEYRTA